MEFTELLDAFAADAGMTEPVAYGKDGDQCSLEINGRDFGFCHRAEAGRLVIWTEIGELPPEGGETLLSRLLRENFMNSDFPEGTLSLSDGDIVCAHCTIRMPVYDKDEFYLLLLRFMKAADEWEQMLDSAGWDESPRRKPEQKPAQKNRPKFPPPPSFKSNLLFHRA